MIKIMNKYRVGHIVSKNDVISHITGKDLYNFYSVPSIQTFNPILINEYTLKGFGFKKYPHKNPAETYYDFIGIIIKWKPFTSGYYFCPNVYESPLFMYIHELQECLCQISFAFQNDEYVLNTFIKQYGNRKLDIMDA